MPWGDDWDPAVVARYRATWQFKAALEIISPALQDRASCESDIIEALKSVEVWREINSRRTPAEQRKLLQRLAKALRAAIKIADQLGPWDLWDLPIQHSDIAPARAENLKSSLKEIEAAAGYITKNTMTKGAPKYSDVRAAAVAAAHSLLTGYSEEPGLSREGPWHELARVLFGDMGADLFDYMNEFRIIHMSGGMQAAIEEMNEEKKKKGILPANDNRASAN
jgi:hypothetical protein